MPWCSRSDVLLLLFSLFRCLFFLSRILWYIYRHACKQQYWGFLSVVLPSIRLVLAVSMYTSQVARTRIHALAALLVHPNQHLRSVLSLRLAGGYGLTLSICGLHFRKHQFVSFHQSKRIIMKFLAFPSPHPLLSWRKLTIKYVELIFGVVFPLSHNLSC